MEKPIKTPASAGPARATANNPTAKIDFLFITNLISDPRADVPADQIG